MKTKANALLKNTITKISGIAMLTSALSTSAHAASLKDLMPKEELFNMQLQVACGHLQKSNCNTVLPRMAEYTVPQGLTLEPIESEGSVESSRGVCYGAVPAAIVQWDAADLVARSTQCVGKIARVGSPIYPYYGFLVTRADFPADSISAMADNPPRGRAWKISDGKAGSGGQVTFQNILRNNPNWDRAIAEVPNLDTKTAFRQLIDGAIDGYFFMDGMTSDLSKLFKDARGDRNQPLFKFIAVDLDDQFYSKAKDWRTGAPLYYDVVLASGGLFGWGRTHTIAVNAVMILNQEFANKTEGSKAADILAEEGIKKSQANIRGDLNVPRDWTGH